MVAAGGDVIAAGAAGQCSRRSRLTTEEAVARPLASVAVNATLSDSALSLPSAASAALGSLMVTVAGRFARSVIENARRWNVLRTSLPWRLPTISTTVALTEPRTAWLQEAVN